jgi:hypothetical protein
MYEFGSEDFRAKVASAIAALRPLCGEDIASEIDAAFAQARDDAQTGRGDAEIKAWIESCRQEV